MDRAGLSGGGTSLRQDFRLYFCCLSYSDTTESSQFDFLRVRLERGDRLRQHSGYDHDRVSHHFQYLHDSLLVRHLKYRQVPLFKGIIVSWGIAFFEYCFQVPANRVGSYELSAVQLKRIQGSNHTHRIFGVLSALPGRPNQVELYCGVRADCGGGVRYFQEMVMV